MRRMLEAARRHSEKLENELNDPREVLLSESSGGDLGSLVDSGGLVRLTASTSSRVPSLLTLSARVLRLPANAPLVLKSPKNQALAVSLFAFGGAPELITKPILLAVSHLPFSVMKELDSTNTALLRDNSAEQWKESALTMALDNCWKKLAADLAVAQNAKIDVLERLQPKASWRERYYYLVKASAKRRKRLGERLAAVRKQEEKGKAARTIIIPVPQQQQRRRGGTKILPAKRSAAFPKTQQSSATFKNPTFRRQAVPPTKRRRL